jgi:hypothetical protein
MLISGPEAGASLFFILPIGIDPEEITGHLRGMEPHFLAAYDLTTGDPAAWNHTDVDEGGRSQRFGTLLHGVWDSGNAAAKVAGIALGAAVYRLDASYALVVEGRATPIGLRGYEAVRTIIEAGAENQLSDEVARAIYGAAGGSH